MQWDCLILPFIYSIKIHTETLNFFAGNDWNWFTKSWKCLFACETLLEESTPPKKMAFLALDCGFGRVISPSLDNLNLDLSANTQMQ